MVAPTVPNQTAQSTGRHVTPSLAPSTAPVTGRTGVPATPPVLEATSQGSTTSHRPRHMVECYALKPTKPLAGRHVTRSPAPSIARAIGLIGMPAMPHVEGATSRGFSLSPKMQHMGATIAQQPMRLLSGRHATSSRAQSTALATGLTGVAAMLHVEVATSRGSSTSHKMLHTVVLIVLQPTRLWNGRHVA